MAISNTYIQLQQQIAQEIGDRTQLLAAGTGVFAPIKNAIQQAIAKWEREPFYFNEIYNSTSPLFTTVLSQELYTTVDAPAIATAPYITDLCILISGSRYWLTKRTWPYLEDLAVSTTNTGQPVDWAYFAETIRLYPIPNGAYPVRSARTQRLAALSADADANVWTQDAYDLIRCEAKRILGQDILHDPDLVAAMNAEIHGTHGYLYALRAESTRRARGRIVPSQF